MNRKSRQNWFKICQKVSHIAAAIAVSHIVALGRNPAFAQFGGVPEADEYGDYESALMLGNLGYYGNTNWLVVATDSLNCRFSPGGEVRSVILPGAIIKAVFDPRVNNQRLLDVTPEMDAIEFSAYTNRPWLRIEGNAGGLAFAPNSRQSHDPGPCYVRASSYYIAPINVDAALD